MNPAERIFRIHHLLKAARQPVPMAKLREATSRSRASLVRDIGYMRDFMRAPIEFIHGENGYRYDPNAPEFELPGLWFNADELYALLATEQLLESVQPGLLSPYVGPLRARIRKLLDQSGHSSETVTQRIRIKPTAARPVESDQFRKVASAVLEACVLNIVYHGRDRDEETARRIHPYRLVHYRSNWYVAAWCERASDLRLFSLDRIRSAQRDETTVRPIDDSALERFLGASFGIFPGTARDWAMLRFSAQSARWVADEQWHPDQIGHWRGEEYELQIPYSDPRELLMEVLKYGPEVDVIGPESLRGMVGERLRAAAARYEKNAGADGRWRSG